MIGTLGPRTINGRDEKGATGVISITIRGLTDKDFDWGADVTVSKKAEVDVGSSWQERVMRAVGADDLQVVFYILRFASICLAQTCRDIGVALGYHVASAEILTESAPFRSVAVG